MELVELVELTDTLQHQHPVNLINPVKSCKSYKSCQNAMIFKVDIKNVKLNSKNLIIFSFFPFSQIIKTSDSNY